MLKHLSIRNKLLVLFTPILVILGANVFLNLQSMGEMNKDMSEITTHYVPSLMVTEEMALTLADYRLRQARHLLSDDMEHMRKASEDMNFSLQALRQKTGEYDKMSASDTAEMKASFARIRTMLENYLTAAKPMIEMSLAMNKGGADELFLGETRTQYNAMREEIKKLAELNLQEVKAADAEANKAYNFILMETYVLSGALVGILLLGMVLLATGIGTPVKKMTSAMDALAQGDLDAIIPAQGQRDEIGSMAKAVQVFKDNAVRMKQMEQDRQESEKRAQEEKKRSMQQLASNFESQVKNVVDMVASAATEMEATAKNVSHIAEDSRKKLNLLTGEVNQASGNVDTVASATTQLSQAISDINRQIARSSSITNNAVDEAQKADGTVQELVAAAGKIGEVISMINSIAEQINLLALNATIEAARAGDAGKGFAVVASEVKALATQTTQATSEITEYVASIQGTTNQTVSVIKAIIETIREISTISTAIAAAVEEQGVATQDIAQNVQQAAASTKEVSSGADAVTRSSAETGEAAHQMTAATSELSKQAEKLRGEVEKFLHGVRTAA